MMIDKVTDVVSRPIEARRFTCKNAFAKERSAVRPRPAARRQHDAHRKINLRVGNPTRCGPRTSAEDVLPSVFGNVVLSSLSH